MFDIFLNWLHEISTKVPIELFVFIGSLVEEVISPIPSPFVLTLTGSLAASRGDATFTTLLVLSSIGALGKTIGSLVFYLFADKAEDIVVTRYGKFFGVSHKHLENIGSKFETKSQSLLILIGLRAIPIMPSLPVSLVAGLIRLPMKTYLVGTFIGNMLRNLLFIYFGFAGVEAFEGIIGGLDQIESIIQIGMFLVAGAVIAWIYYKRHKNS